MAFNLTPMAVETWLTHDFPLSRLEVPSLPVASKSLAPVKFATARASPFSRLNESLIEDARRNLGFVMLGLSQCDPLGSCSRPIYGKGGPTLILSMLKVGLGPFRFSAWSIVGDDGPFSLSRPMSVLNTKLTCFLFFIGEDLILRIVRTPFETFFF